MNRRGTPRAARLGRHDESGGALSLWVVLMVPVSAFAAVVAMAGPQRMAAESSVDEAADDLAALAVAWRDGHGTDGGPLPSFPPECDHRSEEQSETLEQLREHLSHAVGVESDAQEADPVDQTALDSAVDQHRAAQEFLTAYEKRLASWDEVCGLMFEWIAQDLGYLGVDVNSLRGFYSDSLTAAPSLALTGDMALPCRVSQRVEVRDAVHVALTVDWHSAGWAAAQVWPDGARMGAESIGRLRRTVANSQAAEPCGARLDVLDSQGRPVALTVRDSASGRLLESVPGRTVLGG